MLIIASLTDFTSLDNTGSVAKAKAFATGLLDPSRGVAA